MDHPSFFLADTTLINEYQKPRVSLSQAVVGWFIKISWTAVHLISGTTATSACIVTKKSELAANIHIDQRVSMILIDN